LDIGGKANKPDVGGAIERRESGDKLMGYEDSENTADGVKEAHVDTILDDEKSKHPRLKARAHRSDSENSKEEEEEEKEEKNEDEDSENAVDDDDDDGDGDDEDEDDDGDWMDKVDPLEIKKRYQMPPPFAYPASLLSYVLEKHTPAPTTEIVLQYILVDDKGLVRGKSYPVWEMERQKRKMELQKISMTVNNLMNLECCLAILDDLKEKFYGN